MTEAKALTLAKMFTNVFSGEAFKGSKKMLSGLLKKEVGADRTLGFMLGSAATHLVGSQALAFGLGRLQQYDESYYGANSSRARAYDSIIGGVKAGGYIGAALSIPGLDSVTALRKFGKDIPRALKKIPKAAELAGEARLIRASRNRLGFAALNGSMNAALIGGAAYSNYGLPIILGGIGVAGLAAGGIATGATLMGAMKMGLGEYVGAGALAFGAGAAVGVNTNRSPVGEGYIEEVTNSGSTVNKMNYSTAGLVQALHRNRRV